MSFNAAALQLMLDKGMTLQDVTEIASAMESRSKAAERQARYRRAKKARDVTDDDVTRDVTPVPKERHSNLPSSEPKGSSDQDTPVRARIDKFPCPEGVDPEHWRDFRANRKLKRLAETPSAHRRVLGDLAKLADDEWPPGRILEFAAARGWGAIFDPRNSHGSQQNGRSATHQSSGEARIVAAGRSFVARGQAQRHHGPEPG